MTWQLILFIVFTAISIIFFYYLSFIEQIIEKKGIKHNFKNYFKNFLILIQKINNYSKEN